MINDRLAIIKKSTRQITANQLQPPSKQTSATDDGEKLKKRDAKKERKRMIADLIDETVNEKPVEEVKPDKNTDK